VTRAARIAARSAARRARPTFQVTGANAAASVPAASAQTAAVAGAPPRDASLPSITGTANAGYTLTGHTGTWKGSPTIAFAYQWLRSGMPIVGATNPTYTLVDGDAGNPISLQVTASNGYGTPQTATSQAPAIGVGIAPSNTVAPTVGGNATDGWRLTAHPGSWTGSPTIAIAYAWLRCDSGGNNCDVLTGQTGSTYTLTHADVGGTIAVQVTGTNAYGDTTVGAGRTSTIAGAVPVNTVAPAITLSGQTLTGQKGTWTGLQPITYSYQWFLCDAAGTNCATQLGTGTTLTIQPSYAGLTIRFDVSAENGDGGVGAISDAFAIPIPN
jgi:hypothetical protein